MQTTDYTTIKALGRQVVNFDPAAWSAKAEGIVERGCMLKAMCDPKVRSQLLMSGDKTIKQWNPNDANWAALAKISGAHSRKCEKQTVGRPSHVMMVMNTKDRERGKKGSVLTKYVTPASRPLFFVRS